MVSIIETKKSTVESIEAKETLELIKEALSEIEGCYFRVETSDNKDKIVRERVFCYELYHQIRKLQPKSKGIIVNAEIDKRGREKIALKDQKNPDLIFHIPGNDLNNVLICEVKGKMGRKGIKKDFETISTFLEKYDYVAGAFILYGHSFEKFKKFISNNKADFDKVTKGQEKQIYIFIQEGAGKNTEMINYFELME